MFIEDYGIWFIIETHDGERNVFYSKNEVLIWVRDNKVFDAAPPPTVEEEVLNYNRYRQPGRKVAKGGIEVWGTTQGENFRKRRIYREADLIIVLDALERRHEERRGEDAKRRRSKRLS